MCTCVCILLDRLVSPKKMNKIQIFLIICSCYHLWHNRRTEFTTSSHCFCGKHQVGSHESLVLLTNQHLHMFHVCLCVERLYLMYSGDSLT